MINVCQRCGIYRADKEIDSNGPWAICSECGEKHPFVMAPLVLIGGPSGGGKTTVARALVSSLPEVVLLEGDILWRDVFASPQDDYREFYETWLRLLKNIAQSGRPGVLVSVGAAVPQNIEGCVERRYFSQASYLALTASDRTLETRLKSRPRSRKSSDPDFIAKQLSFSKWLVEQGRNPEQPITVIDTTECNVEDTVCQVRRWVRQQLTTS